MARRASREAVDAGPVAELWELPDGWHWRRAREIADVVGGGTPRNASDTANFHANGVPWITPADLSNYDKATIARGARSLSEFGFRNSAARLLPKGTVLISSRAPVGYCAVAANPIATNQGFKSLIPRSGINPQYIRYYVLRSRHYLEANASGTTFKELSGAALGELVFPIPPPEVQDAIVARIDELFADIDEGEKALRDAAIGVGTYGEALLKSAMTGELTADWRAKNRQEETGDSLLHRILADRQARWSADPKNVRKSYSEVAIPDLGSLPSVPTGWAWTTAQCLTTGDRGSIVIGPFGSDLKVSDYTAEGVPLVFVRHIRSGDFVGHRPQCVTRAKAMALKAHEAAPGDLLITKMGDPPGDVAIYPDLPPAIITADCIRWRPHPLVNNEFLAAWINSYWGRTWITRNTKGVAQQKITLENFKSMPVAVPGPSEQKAIVAAVKAGLDFSTEVGSLCDTAAATDLRQSILAAAFRGDLIA